MRRSALASAGIVLPDQLGEAGLAAADDVLDAAVAAWSAHRYGSGTFRHIDPKIVDARGRTVTIWY